MEVRKFTDDSERTKQGHERSTTTRRTFGQHGELPPRSRVPDAGCVSAGCGISGAHPHETVGNWSYGKILQHLTDGLNRSFDGFPFRAIVLIRWIARTLMKKKLLTQPMSPGYKLPQKMGAALPPDSTPVEEALPRLKQAIARFEREEPRASHPAGSDSLRTSGFNCTCGTPRST
jgi:hypothetical protein